MKIMITGGTGQLGGDCAEVLEDKHEIVSLGSRDLDITSGAAVERLVGEIDPHVIINCAAFTKVDACETQRDLARRVNVEGPRNLALAAQKHGVQLIHISTDYVFDGKKNVPEPYTEQDGTNPVSYYGVTKLEAEEAVRAATDNHMIFRTAWLYGIRGQNFPKTMLRLALGDANREVKVVNDQFGSPTWSYRLAQQIARMIETGGRGTYHATCEGYGTWYELATVFLLKMGLPHSFIPCTTKEYPTPAARPKNSILANQRLKAAGLNLMGNWEDDLGVFVGRFRDRLINEASEDLT